MSALGFPMLSGVHEASYAENSGPQNSVVLRCRPLLERAIAMQQALFSEMKKMKRKDGDDVFRIADMGCSTGPNCLANMQFMMDAIAKYSYNNNRDGDDDGDCIGSNGFAIQAFFCDLPSNDFNTLFQLQQAQFLHPSQNGFFPAAVAGTVYGRLFPACSLHLIFSSFCLQWLSQTPPSILKPNSKEWNKGKIWVDGPLANKATGEAYAHQWKQDFQNFLTCRSQEMVLGGMMFLLVLCRSDTFPPHQMHDESCFRNLELSWQQLIEEGVLDQSDLDTFNIPMYLPTPKEILSATNVVLNLKIQSLEVIEEAIGDNYWRQFSHNPSVWAMRVDKFYRSIFWNVTEEHVGSAKCEAIFGRFKVLLEKGLKNLASWDSYWVHPWSSYAVLQIFKGT